MIPHGAICRASLKISLTISLKWYKSLSLSHLGILLCMVRLNKEFVYFLLLDLFNIRHYEVKVKKQWFKSALMRSWAWFYCFFFFLFPNFAFKQKCYGFLYTCQHMHFNFSLPRQSEEGRWLYLANYPAAAAEAVGDTVDGRLSFTEMPWLTCSQPCWSDSWLKHAA